MRLDFNSKLPQGATSLDKNIAAPWFEVPEKLRRHFCRLLRVIRMRRTDIYAMSMYLAQVCTIISFIKWKLWKEK